MLKSIASIVLLVLIAFVCIARANDPYMMTKEQLLPLLGNPDVMIIDVRAKYDWDTSKVKIKGAVREESMKFGSWMNKYPKDKTLVIYCACVNDSTSSSFTQAYRKAGYDKVFYLMGGLRGAWSEWIKAKYPTENK
jgi:rhodanese-related sulfurtransferase